jgi:hypothetical protein
MVAAQHGHVSAMTLMMDLGFYSCISLCVAGRDKSAATTTAGERNVTAQADPKTAKPKSRPGSIRAMSVPKDAQRRRTGRGEDEVMSGAL